MTDQNLERRLAAIFSADVQGYGRLMRDDEMATIRAIKVYREVMTLLIQQHRGRVVDSPGDNLLAEFASVVDAVQAATAVQKELKARNAKLPSKRRMEFRIGINLGDIVAEGERIYGDGVNIAARLEALADPGGICISRTAYDQIEDKLPLAYEYLGEMSVKDAPKPIRAYRVLIEPGVLTKARSWTRGAEPAESHPGHGGLTRGEPVSSCKRLTALLLCLGLGVFGVHRFYVGKTKTAKVQLFTIGGFVIWFLIDLLYIAVGEFEDGEGNKIKDWV